MDSYDPIGDPYGVLGLILNPDGSVTRKPIDPDFFRSKIPSSEHPHDNTAPVISKDITINQEHKTWARVYRPARPEPGPDSKKLPIIVYFHGGGLVSGSAATSITDDFFNRITSEIPAVVVSVEYRLAPEHRLPAAYDDGEETLHVIKTTKDEWLTAHVDFSKCFLMGTSAGGNVAYHVALRVVDRGVEDLNPLKIQGLILHQPFFGGVQRTRSEVTLANNKIFPVSLADIMWGLALPIGADCDHEYSNPTAEVNLEKIEKMKVQGLRVFVTGYHGDPLVDRMLEVFKILGEKRVVVSGMFGEGGYHGYELFDESKAKILHDAVKNFVLSS